MRLDLHRDEFVADLEQAAQLLRNGTVQDVAAFASRNAHARAELAAARAQNRHSAQLIRGRACRRGRGMPRRVPHSPRRQGAEASYASTGSFG